jgi:hypothetical protein
MEIHTCKKVVVVAPRGPILGCHSCVSLVFLRCFFLAAQSERLAACPSLPCCFPYGGCCPHCCVSRVAQSPAVDGLLTTHSGQEAGCQRGKEQRDTGQEPTEARGGVPPPMPLTNMRFCAVPRILWPLSVTLFPTVPFCPSLPPLDCPSLPLSPRSQVSFGFCPVRAIG